MLQAPDDDIEEQPGPRIPGEIQAPRRRKKKQVLAADGDKLAMAWFSGTAEGQSDVAIVLSRVTLEDGLDVSQVLGLGAVGGGPDGELFIGVGRVPEELQADGQLKGFRGRTPRRRGVRSPSKDGLAVSDGDRGEGVNGLQLVAAPLFDPGHGSLLGPRGAHGRSSRESLHV